VWMPQQNWNGRFQGVGGGGLAGVIERLSLALALQRGYASASTDTGHDADPDDGRWALHAPEKITDYGYRAIHEMTVKSKAIVSAYYGKPAAHTYFAGCSNGGRQGLMEAQRYPDDYDGIVAGSPALDGTGTLPAWAWDQQIIRAAPDGVKLKGKSELIEKAVLAACDAIDGIKDGVIDDPRQCHFKPESLQCKNGDADDCLTATQVGVLDKLYAGPGGTIGDSVYYGLEPGGQSGLNAWQSIYDGWFGKSGQYNYTEQFYRYLIYGNPDWRFQQFDFARDSAEMHSRLGPKVDALDADLGPFVARGGKLIIYHGWSDAVLPSRATIHYYERVRATMGAAADGAVKLYMVPGLQHCGLGPGPNSFGQLIPGGTEAPEQNVGAALEAWVEKGRMPERVVASKYDSDIKGIVEPGATHRLRSRPLCPYPQVARWIGSGSTDDAENFRCAAP
jgi:pimeloyl-ACP methyl ester carboxylesterase